ncbi:hypothetical protein ACAG26_17420 [Mycobacterium sp. pUA109]|uniref:hypothetical protein n=1 Tax=Mycobacterium sp. pUA109 TaxID=3238982 RepID=UPI00351B5F35
MRAFTGQLLILAILLLGGCADRGVDLAVSENGRALADFTLARLRELRQVEIATPQSRGAQVQHGPTVRSVLDAAGATQVDRVRVEGRDPAQTLTGELTERVILSETKRHTLKLVGADLDRGRWVRDVTALVVNP